MKARGLENVGRWLHGNDVLADRLWVASGFKGRLFGLQFARTLPPGDAVLLRRCRSVHTAWMRFDLQLLFLDAEERVIEVHDRVKPWRIVIPRHRDVRHVVERAFGAQPPVAVGMQTRVETIDPDG